MGVCDVDLKLFIDAFFFVKIIIFSLFSLYCFSLIGKIKDGD